MAKKGTLLQHKKVAAWGYGVVTTSPANGIVMVLFENDGSERAFKVDMLAQFFEIDVVGVPDDSPLRDEERWRELVTEPVNHDKKAEASDSRTCEHCAKLLRRAQRSSDARWKSCPHCSRSHGKLHVFYRSPDAFGTTPRRVTAQNPNGEQSHCEACRYDKPHAEAIMYCDGVEQ